MGSKNPSTTTSTTTPSTQALAGYNDLVGQAKTAAAAPYQPFSGELTAGLNAGQTQAIGELEGSYGRANPYINAGSGAASNAQTYAAGAAGLANPFATAGYMSPYLSSAVASTRANIDQSNAEQQQQLAGQAIGAGAFGGDRSGIAASSLARQQGLAEGQTLSTMENQGYQQATAARQADASLYGNLANSADQTAQVYGGLGSLAQSTAIQGASAGLQGATLQQQTAQAQDSAAYSQYQNAKAYPFQTLGWLGNIVEGVGSQEGSTTVGTQPAPSALSQITGAATTGLGILGGTGAFGSGGYLWGGSKANGGRVGFADGGGIMDFTRGQNGTYRDAFADGGLPTLATATTGLDLSPTGLTGDSPFNTAPLSTPKPLAASPAPQALGALSASPPNLGATTPAAATMSDNSDSASSGLGAVSDPDHKNLWMGVMSAGLGMMAGTSPFAAANIGAGGLAGLKEYQSLKDSDRQNALAQSEIDSRKAQLGISQKDIELRAQQLHQQALQQDRSLELQQGQLTNQQANTQSEIQARGAQTAASLQTMTPAGILQRDPANPVAPPKLIPFSALTGGQQPSPPAPSGPSQGASALSGGVPQANAASATGLRAPDNIPPNPMMFNDVGKKVIEDQTTKTLDAAKTANDSAQNTKIYLGQMQDALAQLPKEGWLAAGPGQQERAAIAGKVNTILGGLGVDPKNQVNPDAVASSEELKKLTNRMGFDLAKSLGGREPGFIVQQAVGSVPSSENTPLGAQRLIAGLGAMAQRQSDYYNFMQDWASKSGGSVAGADQYFNKYSPPEKYVGMAVLSTLPQPFVDRLRSIAKSDPTAVTYFDQRFGKGTAALALGQ